jgi:amidohydrolase
MRPLLLLALCAPLSLLGQQWDKEVGPAAVAQRAALVAQRRDLHMHPELSNQETRTAKVVADRLKALGLEVRTDVAIHGVVGVLKGGLPGPIVAYRADMDALPITEVHDVPYKSLNTGVMHACGHDAHTTIGLGIAELLSQRRAKLKGTVVFLFQPAEEGAPGDAEGGAALMIKEGALENPHPEAVFGLHVSADYAVGQMAVRAGAMLASVDTWTLTIKGKMSHGGANPHKGIDAVYVASQCIEALQSIRSRRIDPLQPIVISVGTIHGGLRDNIIAPEVKMEGTLRTLNSGVRTQAKALMQQILDNVTAAHGATAELYFRKSTAYPPTVNDDALIAAIRPTLSRVLAQQFREAEPIMGAEDFSFYAERIPGAFLWLGVANASKGMTAGPHTPEFDLDEESLVVGVRTMSSVLLDYLERGGLKGSGR